MEITFKSEFDRKQKKAQPFYIQKQWIWVDKKKQESTRNRSLFFFPVLQFLVLIPLLFCFFCLFLFMFLCFFMDRGSYLMPLWEHQVHCPPSSHKCSINEWINIVTHLPVTYLHYIGRRKNISSLNTFFDQIWICTYYFYRKIENHMNFHEFGKLNSTRKYLRFCVAI